MKMTKREYEDRYFDKKDIATRVASALRIPVGEALSATNRRTTKNIAIYNHYGKLLGHVSFHDLDMLLQDLNHAVIPAEELEAGLWSAAGVEIADGFFARDKDYRADTEPTFYEPLDHAQSTE